VKIVKEYEDAVWSRTLAIAGETVSKWLFGVKKTLGETTVKMDVQQVAGAVQ